MVAIVNIYESGLIRAVQTDGKHWNRSVAREIEALAISWCPSSSGHLASCHGVEQNRLHGAFSTGFSVFNDAKTPSGRPLAIFIHNGTGLFGPTGSPIVPVNTPKRKFLHLPAHMGFRWSTSTKVIGAGPRRKGVRRPFVRIFDPSDPYGHAESTSGNEANPWLFDAGMSVSRHHG